MDLYSALPTETVDWPGHTGQQAAAGKKSYRNHFFVGFHSFLPRSGVKNCLGTVEAILYGPVRRPKFNPQKRGPNSDRCLRDSFLRSHAQTAKANATYQNWFHELKPMGNEKHHLYDFHFSFKTIQSRTDLLSVYCGGPLERGWKLQVQRRPNLSRERLPPCESLMPTEPMGKSAQQDHLTTPYNDRTCQKSPNQRPTFPSQK